MFIDRTLSIHILQGILVKLMDQKLLIHVDHITGGPFCQLHTFVQKYNPVTIFCNAGQIMADKQNGLAQLLELFKFMITFCLEEYVSNLKCLSHEQDLWINIDSHCKCKTYKHTAGIGLHRLMDKFADISKIQDCLQSVIDLLL